MNNEPIITPAAITAVVTAIIAFVVAFGVNLTDQQTAAILGLVGVLSPIAIWWYGRKGTVPVDKANAQIEKVAKMEPTSNVDPLKFTKG